jgi:membrane protein DedA with SNARE-associated domain
MGGLLGILILAAAIWVIYDVWVNNRRFTDTEKLIWTIAAVVFSLLTAVIYFVTQKRKSGTN